MFLYWTGCVIMMHLTMIARVRAPRHTHPRCCCTWSGVLPQFRAVDYYEEAAIFPPAFDERTARAPKRVQQGAISSTTSIVTAITRMTLWTFLNAVNSLRPASTVSQYKLATRKAVASCNMLGRVSRCYTWYRSEVRTSSANHHDPVSSFSGLAGSTPIARSTPVVSCQQTCSSTPLHPGSPLAPLMSYLQAVSFSAPCAARGADPIQARLENTLRRLRLQCLIMSLAGCTAACFRAAACTADPVCPDEQDLCLWQAATQTTIASSTAMRGTI
jgi:hypothetical protein